MHPLEPIGELLVSKLLPAQIQLLEQQGILIQNVSLKGVSYNLLHLPAGSLRCRDHLRAANHWLLLLPNGRQILYERVNGLWSILRGEPVVQEHLLTVQEVARKLRVDPTTVRRWIKNGALPAISFPEKVGRQRQIHRIRASALAPLLHPVEQPKGGGYEQRVDAHPS